MDEKITLNEARAAVALQTCITTLDAVAKEKYKDAKDYSGYNEAVFARNEILGFSAGHDLVRVLKGAQMAEQTEDAT